MKMNKNFQKQVGFFQNYTSQSAIAKPLSAVIDIVTSDTMRRITDDARLCVLYNEQSHKKEATDRYNDIKVHHTPAVQPSLLYDTDGVRKSAKTCENLNDFASGIFHQNHDNLLCLDDVIASLSQPLKHARHHRTVYDEVWQNRLISRNSFCHQNL